MPHEHAIGDNLIEKALHTMGHPIHPKMVPSERKPKRLDDFWSVWLKLTEQSADDLHLDVGFLFSFSLYLSVSLSRTLSSLDTSIKTLRV